MASKTRKTKMIRKRKRTKIGQRRKKKIVKLGTTPAFPIHQ
jgi:hypothetical protein